MELVVMPHSLVALYSRLALGWVPYDPLPFLGPSVKTLITACVVVFTGAFGGMFGHRILKLIGVKNDIAIGLSIGAASHVIGTSKCVEIQKEKQVVMASVALVIVGILTAILAPLFLYLLGN